MSEEVNDQEQLEDQEDTELEEADESQEGEETESGDDEFDRDRVRAKLRKLNSENRNLRQAKKDAEEKAAESEGKTEQVQALEAKNARYETLAEHDLPLKLAKFISATEPDEILEQAEELLSLGSSKAPPQDQPKERVKRRRVTPPADELNDLDSFAEKIFRK